MKDAAGFFMCRTQAKIQVRGMFVCLSLRCLTRSALAFPGHLSYCGVNHGPSRSHGSWLGVVQSLKTEFSQNSGFDDLPQTEMDSSGAKFGARFRHLSDWNEVFNSELCDGCRSKSILRTVPTRKSPVVWGPVPEVPMPLSTPVSKEGRRYWRAHQIKAASASTWKTTHTLD